MYGHKNGYQQMMFWFYPKPYWLFPLKSTENDFFCMEFSLFATFFINTIKKWKKKINKKEWKKFRPNRGSNPGHYGDSLRTLKSHTLYRTELFGPYMHRRFSSVLDWAGGIHDSNSKITDEYVEYVSTSSDRTCVLYDLMCSFLSEFSKHRHTYAKIHLRI